MTQGVENAPFQFLAAHIGAIVAGALVAGRRAAEQGAGDHRIAATTAAAFAEAGEQVAGTAFLTEMIGRGCIACVPAGADAGLPRLDRVP
ncbi:hypothetical protein AD930_02800 [Acetobacter malorum]|nr:hypothetical protein AD930_02800 [Acetobacter malorum]